MGYRSRIGRIKKGMKDEVEGLSCKEIKIKFSIDSIYYNLPDFEELYEIGKYVSFGDGTEAFFSFDIYEECEAEFYIMSKEKLAEMIKSFANDIAGHYHALKTKHINPKYDSRKEIEAHFETKARD